MKFSSSSAGDHFVSLEELLLHLNSEDEEVVQQACRVWRQQIRIEAQRQKQPLLIVQYFESSPEAAEVRRLVDDVVAKTFESIAIVVELCHALLEYGAMVPTIRANVIQFTDRLLRQRMKVLYQLLSADDQRISNVALDYLRTIAGVDESLVRTLVQKFNFQFQPFTRLSNAPKDASSAPGAK